MRNHDSRNHLPIRSFQFLIPQFLCGDFFNSIGQSRRFGDVCNMSDLPPTPAVMMQCRERQKSAKPGREQMQ